MKNITQLLSLTLLMILASCASTYRPVNPASLNYPVIEKGSGFSYRYNILAETANRKLSKKEDKKHIRVIAIKLLNQTDHTLKYGTNFRIMSGSSEVMLLPPSEVSASLKQSVPVYLLYLLFTPFKFTVETEKESSSTPVGLILGPALAGGNMAVAAAANKRFKAELFNNSIIGREIKPGETIYGLIGIRDNGFLPLSIEQIK